MSSHRESPLLLSDPAADNTDVYAFRDPAKPTHVTLISNWIPLEEPAGGPNFHLFADDVLYEILIDNNGDGIEDITYQWQFRTENPTGDTSFLYNFPAIGVDGATGEYTGLNVKQFYTLTKIVGPRRTGKATVIGQNLRVAPANVGGVSTPNYGGANGLGNLVAPAIYSNLNGTGIDAFAGPRDEGFFLNLGQIFDLLGIMSGIDFTSGFNVHSVALRVPISQLTGDGSAPTSRDDPAAVIGVWSTASRRKAVIRDAQTGLQHQAGPWVQVSRLGNPLINEVVIPRGRKDFWNVQEPKDDAQFLTHYTNPELAAALNIVFSLAPPAPTSGRSDLQTILLTGIPALAPFPSSLPDDLEAALNSALSQNLNFTGTTLADLLRLNVAILPTPAASASPFGVLGLDLAGFPNGRRVFDDVTDIEIRAVRGEVLALLTGNLALAAPVLSDGSQANDVSFLTDFPWLGTPHSGSGHVHDHS